MKFIIFLFAGLLIASVLCIVQDEKTVQGKLQTIKKVKKARDFTIHKRIIFDEFNEYRKAHLISSQKIEWSNTLATSAEKEATNLVKKRNSLGDHESFKTWSEGNEHFTEIAVKINSFGRIKSKKIFAMAVLQAIHEKYRFYLAQHYSQVGVGMKNYRSRGKYAIVFHLVSK